MKQWSCASITGSYDEAVVSTLPQTFQKFNGNSQVQPGYIQHLVLLWTNDDFHSDFFRKTWHLDPTLLRQHVLMTESSSNAYVTKKFVSSAWTEQ